MLTSALSTIGYYVLAIVLGIAANVLTPAVAGRLGRPRAQRPRDDEVQARSGVLIEGRAAEALVVAVGLNVVTFAGGATLVLLGAAFTVIAVVMLTHNVTVGFTIPGIHSARDFLAGIAQGVGFGIVFGGGYWMAKGLNDMLRLQRAHRSEPSSRAPAARRDPGPFVAAAAVVGSPHALGEWERPEVEPPDPRTIRTAPLGAQPDPDVARELFPARPETDPDVSA